MNRPGWSWVNHFLGISLFNKRCEEMAHRLLGISGHLSRSCIERFRDPLRDKLLGERDDDDVAHTVVGITAHLAESCMKLFCSPSGDRLLGEKGGKIADTIVDTDAYRLGSPTACPGHPTSSRSWVKVDS